MTDTGFVLIAAAVTDHGGAGRIPLKLPGAFWKVFIMVVIHSACSGSVAVGAGAVVNVVGFYFPPGRLRLRALLALLGPPCSFSPPPSLFTYFQNNFLG